ncbi:membrane protein [Marichromatium purpuratum 984]|uniref:Membrane protein n=1 Tax=Marichromatium purpuratum 984 TaxID=765910 RepID=W0DWE5_MARPU|nr:Slp family lipoprotein [Marichromatium purpuratum]AHF02930.1 membrane protein [Marichromatium purpuratum 984]
MNSTPTAKPRRAEPAHRLGAILALGLPLWLAGCASGVPEAIRHATGVATTPAAAQQAPMAHLGERVRWGGTILAVHNHAEHTTIELLARALDSSGEPDPEAPGEGRFLAEFPGFVDPAGYPEERTLTVVGILLPPRTRAVGDYPYRYPVVAVEHSHLWPEPVPAPRYPAGVYAPYPWYGPWRGPWYGPW